MATSAHPVTLPGGAPRPRTLWFPPPASFLSSSARADQQAQSTHLLPPTFSYPLNKADSTPDMSSLQPPGVRKGREWPPFLDRTWV